MTTSLEDTYKNTLDRGRALIDRMAVDARLLRSDLRDRKDETIEALESAYQSLQDRIRELASQAGDGAESAAKAAHEASEKLRAKLAEAGTPDSQG